MKINLLETYTIILESKKSEVEATNLLSNNGIEEQEIEKLIQDFKSIDSSKNQKNLPFIAHFYLNGGNNPQQLKTIFDSYTNLLNLKKIKPLNYSKKGGMVLDGNPIVDFIKFSEVIHSVEAKYKNKDSSKIDVKALDEIKPLYSSNNIELYDGQNREKCISYGAGGLSGEKLPFCIGDKSLANNMYHRYRLGNQSTFYYVLDNNKDNKDPLHVVVIDNKGDNIELTDMSNTTGNIAEFGSDTDGYLQYLKGKGIPIDKIVNVELSNSEKLTKEKAMDPIRDLKQFIDLVQNHYEDAQRYLEFGNILTDEQFDYLLNI